MPFIGVNDKIAFSSTYDISTAGVVTRASGSDSFITKGVSVGDSIVLGSAEYIVKSITSATALSVFVAEFGGSVPSQSGATTYVQQKPKYVKRVIQPIGGTSIGQRVDVYGVSTGATGTFSPTEQQIARSYNNHTAHAGWVRHTSGYGPVTGVTVTNGGWFFGSTGPAVTFSTTVGATGVILATGYAVMSTPAVTGGSTGCYVTSVVVTNGGLFTTNPNNWVGGATGFTNPVTVTMAKVGATGIAATGTVTLGGRFGRNLNETLVAFKNINNDANDDAIFPDA